MSTPTTLRRAFTLVEMLVVIAILAILAAALIPKLAQIQENGWATRCKANLKNLYQATLNFEQDNNTADGTGHGLQDIPCAGSYEVLDAIHNQWQERAAWIRWIPLSGTTWPDWSDGKSHASEMHPQNGTYPLWYGDQAMLAITNIETGNTLWDYTGNQPDTYLCPRFARVNMCGRTDPRRNYVMNGFFNCVDAGWAGWFRRNIQWNLSNKDPSRLPLFCDGGKGNNDGVLHVNKASGTVSGFMCVHKIAGHLQCQVVYLDGHVTATTNLSYAACNGDE